MERFAENPTLWFQNGQCLSCWNFDWQFFRNREIDSYLDRHGIFMPRIGTCLVDPSDTPTSGKPRDIDSNICRQQTYGKNKGRKTLIYRIATTTKIWLQVSKKRRIYYLPNTRNWFGHRKGSIAVTCLNSVSTKRKRWNFPLTMRTWNS